MFFRETKEILWIQLQAYFYENLDQRYAPVVLERSLFLIEKYFTDEEDRVVLSAEAESVFGENFKAFLFSRWVCVTGESADRLTDGVIWRVRACAESKAHALTLGEK